MARIEYPAPDDPDSLTSQSLAQGIGLLILSQTDKVNIAITGLTHALGATLTFVPEAEFESTLACVCESVRTARAVCLAPPVSEMN